MIIVPPPLQPGSIIGMLCPAGHMPADKAQTCIDTLQEWGFSVRVGSTLGNHFNYFSGTDEERLQDLQLMLDDEEVDAIVCARGGYGISRILDKLDFTAFCRQPKWIVGFSDVTALHAHIFTQFNIATLHAPMAAAFNDGEYKNVYVQSLKLALYGAPYTYACNAYRFNICGMATGQLVGGNLALLAHLVGSRSSLDTSGKILFIEDIGEYIYAIDRMMIQLQRAGMLQDLAGLIVGHFTDTKDTILPFGASEYDVIYERVKEYGYPVCFGFPVGHVRENYALLHGAVHTLQVAESGVQLTQMHS